MKYIKYFLIFFVPFILVTTGIVVYFILTQKITKISSAALPSLPSLSISDFVKFTRFSLEKAPSQSLVGTITSMSGDVNYEPRLATVSAKITNPVNVQQGEGLETGVGGKLILNFKDAAEINLSEESGVNIIQTLPADLVFAQTIGSVEYKKLGNIPVTIKVGHLLVENMGDLKISFTRDSPVTTIVIIDGTATVAYNDLNNDSKVINLSTGQTLRFNEGNRKAVTK